MHLSAKLKALGRLLPDPAQEALRRLAFPERYHQIRGTPTYDADGLISWHNCEFMDDPRFRAAYAAGEATGSWKGSRIPWRAYVVCWSANQVKDFDGDFVECGVNRGGYARAVCEYVDFGRSSRTFYLLDTFQGLDEKQLTAAEIERGFTRSMGRGYDECYADVVRTFQEYPNVRIVRGAIPETLSQVTAERVAFLSIDMNCVAPEIAAAEFFWDKIVSGGVVVLDDYGFSFHILQKRAFDEFASRKGIQVLSLPTGQGLIVKP